MTAYEKPLPVIDHDSRPYWEGARAQELRAQRCTHCGRLRWPPVGVCPQCHQWDHAWERLSDTGTVTSFVTVHRPGALGFADEIPYVIAKITIDDTDGNVTLTSNIIGCGVEAVKVGVPVRVVFKQATPEITIPLFEPIAP
jgi:uncharacterized OB-fold protein